MLKTRAISLILAVTVLTVAVHAWADQPVFKTQDSFRYSYVVAFSRSNFSCVVRAFFTVKVVDITPPLVEYTVGDYTGVTLTGECGEFGLTREAVEMGLREYTSVDRLDLNPYTEYIGFFANPSYTGEFTDRYPILGGGASIMAKYVKGVLTRYSERLETPLYESALEINLVSSNVYFSLYPSSLAIMLAGITVTLAAIFISAARALGGSRGL
ncbi:MAG: hypothetical protein QXW58_02260 [Thermosphaera sp.]